MKPLTKRHFLLNLFALAVLLIVALFAVTTAEGRGKPMGLVICEEFGDRYCAQALRVGYCESGLRTEARNGQYRGIWQMGSWERRKYGHGSTVRAQARAANRYFVASGRDWSPWACRWAAT